MTSRAVLRLCPACGGALLGTAGVPWFSCEACALAWDLFASPPARTPTFRPGGEVWDGSGPRLPFYLFEVGSAGSVWVPAYRARGSDSGTDAARALTRQGLRPDLIEAPLGAAVARGPEEARRLAVLRDGIGDAAAVSLRALVSLGCRREGGAFVEPMSGFRFGPGEIRPGTAPRR